MASTTTTGNMQVAIRVRPLSAQEANTHQILRAAPPSMLVFDPKADATPEQAGVPNHTKRKKDATLVYNHVFDEYSTSHEVFEATTKPLVAELIDGYNCSCFAYGATGAGKTYTMIGNEEQPGVMVLVLRELFAKMEEQRDEKKFDVKLSYLEIYNESVRDLLVDVSPPLVIRDSGGAVVVAGLSSHQPQSVEEVFTLLSQGNARRTQAYTAANAESSRSHAVCQVVVESKLRHSGMRTSLKRGKLSLVDLAGSERAARTKNQGVRLREGANINKSLLALGNCINALGRGRARQYVPYRNSKLTRLLKDSLDGNCKTVMIANVSPSALHYEDSWNTLQYANRAKNIKLNTKRNEVNIRTHVSAYGTIVRDLNLQIAEMKGKLVESEKLAQQQPLVQPLRETREGHQYREKIQVLITERGMVHERLQAVWRTEATVRASLHEQQCALAKYTAQLQDDTSHLLLQLREELQREQRKVTESEASAHSLVERLHRNAKATLAVFASLKPAIANEWERALLQRDVLGHSVELEKINHQISVHKQECAARLQEQVVAQKDLLIHALVQQLQEHALLTPEFVRTHAQQLSSARVDLPAPAHTSTSSLRVLSTSQQAREPSPAPSYAAMARSPPSTHPFQQIAFSSPTATPTRLRLPSTLATPISSARKMKLKGVNPSFVQKWASPTLAGGVEVHLHDSDELAGEDDTINLGASSIRQLFGNSRDAFASADDDDLLSDSLFRDVDSALSFLAPSASAAATTSAAASPPSVFAPAPAPGPRERTSLIPPTPIRSTKSRFTTHPLASAATAPVSTSGHDTEDTKRVRFSSPQILVAPLAPTPLRPKHKIKGILATPTPLKKARSHMPAQTRLPAQPTQLPQSAQPQPTHSVPPSLAKRKRGGGSSGAPAQFPASNTYSPSRATTAPLRRTPFRGVGAVSRFGGAKRIVTPMKRVRTNAPTDSASSLNTPSRFGGSAKRVVRASSNAQSNQALFDRFERDRENADRGFSRRHTFAGTTPAKRVVSANARSRPSLGRSQRSSFQ